MRVLTSISTLGDIATARRDQGWICIHIQACRENIPFIIFLVQAPSRNHGTEKIYKLANRE